MKMAKNIIVLSVITIIAGFLLGYVYDITKEPIAAATEKAKQEAYKSVFSDAASFTPVDGFDSESVTALVTRSGLTGVSVDEALNALDASGTQLGYVFTTTSSDGYGGDITLSVGVKNDGTINGIEFLTLAETAGLGMNADTDDFKNQFKGMCVTQVTYTKTGRTNDYEIDAISGATITTSAVTNAVNAGLTYFGTLSGGAADE